MATAKKKTTTPKAPETPTPVVDETPPADTTEEGTTTENVGTDNVSGDEVTTTEEVNGNEGKTGTTEESTNTADETTPETTTTVDETSAPVTPDNPLGSEVTMVDEDGKYVGEVLTSEEADALQAAETEAPVKLARKQCQGLFAMMDGKDFTQNEKYSDTYLKSKGLFKGE